MSDLELCRMIGEIYRSPSRLAKMSFEERRKLVSTFFAGRDAQSRRLGVYLERDKKTGAVKYEIREVFGKTFPGEVTPDSLSNMTQGQRKRPEIVLPAFEIFRS